MWRGTASRLRFDLDDGLEVICHGHVDVYAPRGTYQLVVDQVHPKGVGALELALRKLRDKLEKEGLFDPRRKRPLPAFPRRVAIVTSPTGAAIRDFLQVSRRRWQGVDILVIPARVQGEGAAQEIVAAISAANRLRDTLDVLVVARGGGSLEDLWAFNEEPVVRAIAASRIPTVSAVGHEIDVTLSDLAADVRALTPSEAAERVFPAAEDVRAGLKVVARRLWAAIRAKSVAGRARLDWIVRQRVFRRPLDGVHDLARRLDELASRARRSLLQIQLRARTRVDRLAGKLESLSPLGVLERGYSLTVRREGGLPVCSATELMPGEEIITRFAEGQATSRVERTES
jgi:exodeoxyribonuclease VII large subunit